MRPYLRSVSPRVWRRGGLVLALVACGGVWPNGQSTAQTVRLPVFVTSAGAVNGFTDPNRDNQEAVEDVQDALKKQKGIGLVSARDEALLALVVQSREKGAVIFKLGPRMPGREVTIRVKFEFGDQITEIAGVAGGNAKAAGKIADQVMEWVKANRHKLQVQ